MTGGYPLEFSPKKFPAVNIPSSTNGSPTTYDEVVEIVGTELPDGFGIKVGKTTLCRYYKAHFEVIGRPSPGTSRNARL